MTPQKLCDEMLELILRNVEMQLEVKEITDGSVQEVLQKLLRAETVLTERKRWKQTNKLKPLQEMCVPISQKREIMGRIQEVRES